MTDRRVGGSALIWLLIVLSCVGVWLAVVWTALVVFQAVFGA